MTLRIRSPSKIVGSPASYLKDANCIQRRRNFCLKSLLSGSEYKSVPVMDPAMDFVLLLVVFTPLLLMCWAVLAR
jgi:hypothetical protein